MAQEAMAFLASLCDQPDLPRAPEPEIDLRKMLEIDPELKESLLEQTKGLPGQPSGRSR